MLNEIRRAIRRHGMVLPGDTVICEVSGGADSVALLCAMVKLRESLQIRLEAAHVNHHLRGEESQRDEQFVRQLCSKWQIPLHVAQVQVGPGEKGLEAAAREARYAFFYSLSGKIATAHTAEDNAETVLMRLTRGTGLQGLCGIPPVNGNVIRPMLTVTRDQVLSFLREQGTDFVHDSSNDSNAFFRNRIRHRVLPLLEKENPRFSLGVSDMAEYLRQDRDYLQQEAEKHRDAAVSELRQLHPAIRNRVLEMQLTAWGMTDIGSVHIKMMNSLVDSENPSARVSFPGGLVAARAYDKLVRLEDTTSFSPVVLPNPGSVRIPEQKLLVTCTPSDTMVSAPDAFTVKPQGAILLRPRREGDSIRLGGGTKTVKKTFIDKKIPAAQRERLPVAADEAGVLGIYSIGGNLDRLENTGVTIRFIKEEI